MRIALISEHASPLATLGGVDAGGQNAHVAALAGELAAQQHDVRVYTRRDDPGLPAYADADGYRVVHVPAGPPTDVGKDELLPYMGEFAQLMAADWTAFRPDVAHAHFWMSGLATVTASRSCAGDVPVVQTYHALGSVKRRHQRGADTSPQHRVAYERELGRTVDRVVAQCRDELDELMLMGVPRSRATLVPSGVDTALFRPLGPAQPRGERRRILTVGRLVERKGYELLIRALPQVPRAELVVVGGPPGVPLDDDPYARRLRTLADRLGVTDRVRLVGAVPHTELPTWYRSADVVATVPWYEPFGLTPLEAMACGVPVVAAAVGGLTDTVVDGVTGDLVPSHDPAALATALRRLLGDDMRRFSYAAAAVDRAARSYSWPRITQRLLSVYTSVTAPSPAEVSA